MPRKRKFAGGGALRAAIKRIERTKPSASDALELARLKRMRANAGSIEGVYAGAGQEYDAVRAAMLGRALNDGIYAADKTFPEPSVNLLKLVDPAAPSSVARGALSFRNPGHFSGAQGVPPDAVYIDDLGALRTPHVPVGSALLHRLQEETNGLPLVLESLERPETLQWYADRGFREIPKDSLGKNPFGSRLPALILPRGAKLKAKGGRVKTDKQVSADMREGALSGLRRFFSAIPQAVRDWPQQTWDMVRMPADLLLGSPDENRIAREYAATDLKPLPADTARNPHRPGSPESKAYETMAWANPLQAAVFAPAQTARMVASPIGQATLGGLAALTLPGVNMPSAFAAGNIIKPTGGQWLGTGEGGTLRRVLNSLKREGTDLDPSKSITQKQFNTIERAFPELIYDYGNAQNVAGRHTMHYASDFWPWVQKERPQHFADLMEGRFPHAALNRWIDGPLRKYILRDLATEGDPVRALAERGVLHVDRQPGYFIQSYAKKARNLAGFPEEGSAQHPLAKSWEALADTIVAPSKAAAWQRHGDNLPREIKSDTAWLAKTPPDTPVYNLKDWGDTATQDLGLDHLLDELSNALNPQSGLPRELLLKPNSLQRLSMPQAVEHVARINAWREAQKVAANQELANRAAVVREYAENNPKGLRWVELKANTDIPLPDDIKVKPGKNGIWFMESADGIQTRLGSFDDVPLQQQKAAAEKAAIGKISEVRKALADQLKYEGDTMGHCVGGYCDDVLEGRSRIFSLRDAKGEPHVTVEVQTAKVNPNADSIEESGIEPLIGELEKTHPQLSEFLLLEPANKDLQKQLKQVRPDLFKKYFDPFESQKIVQIKGKANRAPNPEYLPFVQDFVRNSPLGSAWDDVGDLQNAGLRRTIDAFNSNELKKIQDAGIEVPFLATQQELQDIGKRVWPDSWGSILPVEKAEGGSVRAEDWKSAYNAGVNDDWKADYNLSLQETA